MYERVEVDQCTIKLSLNEEIRSFSFKIPMTLLKEFAKKSGESPYQLTHERAATILKSLYDLPDDAYVNYMASNFGYGAVDVIMSSKDFAPIPDPMCGPIPEWKGVMSWAKK